MRILAWGIVALFGLGIVLEALAVHGSRDERAAIRRALRAPLADLRRRDARALCADFTPGVDTRLAGGGVCVTRVDALLHQAAQGAQYVPVVESAAGWPLTVTHISWQGSRATAVSLRAGDAASKRRWRLRRLAGRWRIATPAKLEMQAACPRPASAARSCVYALALRFASVAGG